MLGPAGSAKTEMQKDMLTTLGRRFICANGWQCDFNTFENISDVIVRSIIPADSIPATVIIDIDNADKSAERGVHLLINAWRKARSMAMNRDPHLGPYLGIVVTTGSGDLSNTVLPGIGISADDVFAESLWSVSPFGVVVRVSHMAECH